MIHGLYHAIYLVASVLEIPVVILSLLALVVVIVEAGRFTAELVTRRRRSPDRFNGAQLAAAASAARRELTAGGDAAPARARDALAPVACSAAMDRTFAALVAHAQAAGADSRLAKDLADFDFASQRRLSGTRLLVRAGPALGLMGTLIPLAPALDGLARGDVSSLTSNLRLAFSVTVLGLFVGVVAFGLSLVRDRLYGQDYSDLEFVASVLTDDAPTLDQEPAPEASA
jgi:biopolymer transport protein ExbB/TolQ